MSKKPKKKDYQASDLEKTNAAVAAAEQRFFRENYQPLLVGMRDESLKEGDQQRILKDRAQADTMQTLTQRPSLAATQSVDYQSDLASAALGQQMQASRAAKDISTTMQSGVLGVARGQAADAQSGLAAASRLKTSKELAVTQAKFKARLAKGDMFARIGAAGFGKFMDSRQIDPTTGKARVSNKRLDVADPDDPYGIKKGMSYIPPGGS